MVKKILFYEDIEDVTFEEWHRTLQWYDDAVARESEYYSHYKERVEHNFSQIDNNCIPVIHCERVMGVEDTLDELESFLEKHEYTFKNKISGEWTEQKSSRLMRSVNDSGEVFYVFLDLTYSIWYRNRGK